MLIHALELPFVGSTVTVTAASLVKLLFDRWRCLRSFKASLFIVSRSIFVLQRNAVGAFLGAYTPSKTFIILL